MSVESGPGPSVMSTFGVAAAVVGLTVAQPLATVAAPAVLAALVIEGSSANGSGDSITNVFDGKFKQGPPVYINFLTGPFGIWRALASADAPDDITSSGEGTDPLPLLNYMEKADPDNPVLGSGPTTWVIDSTIAKPSVAPETELPWYVGDKAKPSRSPLIRADIDIDGEIPEDIGDAVGIVRSWMAQFERRQALDTEDTVDAPEAVEPAPDNDPLAKPGSVEQTPAPAGTQNVLHEVRESINNGLETLKPDHDPATDNASPAPERRNRPLLNVVRSGPLYVPGSTKPVDRTPGGPRPVSLSIKAALEKLAQAFAPTTTVSTQDTTTGATITTTSTDTTDTSGTTDTSETTGTTGAS